jgi:hypothetical protein
MDDLSQRLIAWQSQLMRLKNPFAASFRHACAGRQPESIILVGFPRSPRPISGLPEIGTKNAHIGYSRCAMAPA